MAEQEIVSSGEFSSVSPQYSRLFQYNISFIDSPPGEIERILPFGMIHPSGKIFCRIPLAPVL